MSRTVRPQLPGSAFHITARTQGGRPYFRDFELFDRVNSIIEAGMAVSDSLLIARTVMPNHFHIVLKQGRQSLGAVMQPICRRIACLVQKHRPYDGHVFERRFRSHLLGDPDYFRSAVIYTHLNPVRARLCEHPGEYSSGDYNAFALSTHAGNSRVDIQEILRVFGDSGSESDDELRQCYRSYVAWRLDKDRHLAAGLPYVRREPSTISGDVHFAKTYGGMALGHIKRKDLRDRAVEILFRIEPAAEIDMLRCRWLPRRLVAVRYQLIAALLQGGYKNSRIADFFRISDTTVSMIAVRIRHAHLCQN